MEDTLDKLKVLIGLSGYDQDELLTALLLLGEQKILDRLYPFDDTMTSLPSRYVSKQMEIAAWLYNKRGAEGQVAHSENGINRTYKSADIPESLLAGVTPKVGVL